MPRDPSKPTAPSSFLTHDQQRILEAALAQKQGQKPKLRAFKYVCVHAVPSWASCWLQLLQPGSLGGGLWSPGEPPATRGGWISSSSARSAMLDQPACRNSILVNICRGKGGTFQGGCRCEQGRCCQGPWRSRERQQGAKEGWRGPIQLGQHLHSA
jgi:hypothetical protein